MPHAHAIHTDARITHSCSSADTNTHDRIELSRLETCTSALRDIDPSNVLLPSF